MGKIRLQKGSEEFELFQDYWNLYQENFKVEDDDAYWNKVVEDSGEFYQKYKSAFAKELASAYMNELERKAKNEL